MEQLALNLILPLIEQLLPLFSAGSATTKTIGLVIKGLQTAIPLLGQFQSALLPKIKNIIAVVSADPAATELQRVALRAMDKASDAAFDAAMAAAEAEDEETIP